MYIDVFVWILIAYVDLPLWLNVIMILVLVDFTGCYVGLINVFYVCV